MPVFSRHVTVDWSGPLREGGKGVATAGTGAFNLPVSFLRRVGEPEGVTSPEELIAAAHASCFSMALSGALAKAGNPPERLRTSATVTFVPGTGITKSALTVRGSVPGLDADGFREAAEGAKQNCPVSQALAGVPEITLDAQLD